MERVSAGLNRVCEVGLILFLSAMSVVVFLEVIFRYIFSLPLFWTEEFARYCLVWASLLGATIALREGEHIAVTFFMDHVPQRLRRAMILAAQISICCILVVIVWGGVNLVLVTSKQISPALRIPMAIPYLALPFGSAVMLVHAIHSVVSLRTRKQPAGTL
jgi:TRAP-type C4-dicarboxylate transport system permease small subunit